MYGWMHIWREDCETGRTWIVSAATSWHAPSPCVFKLWLCPFLELIACECIRGEVADLKARILAQEVRKWHPVDKTVRGKSNFSAWVSSWNSNFRIFFITLYQNSPSSERLVSLARSSPLTYLHSEELEKSANTFLVSVIWLKHSRYKLQAYT